MSDIPQYPTSYKKDPDWWLPRSQLGDVQHLRRMRIKAAWPELSPEDKTAFKDEMDPADLTLELVQRIEQAAYR